jgi:hypothetical protein
VVNGLWFMNYWLPPGFPPVLWYCKFGNFPKNSNISEINTLVMGNNWATWKKQQSVKISQFFLLRNDKICWGKRTLIATSLVVNLLPEHIRCVQTLSHIPTSMVTSKSRQPERNMGKLNTHHAQNATCGGSWRSFGYESNKCFIRCAKGKIM